MSVSAVRLADLLDLVDRVLPTVLDEQLRTALNGAAANVRVEATVDAILEPA